MRRLLPLAVILLAGLAVAQPDQDPREEMERWLRRQRTDLEDYLTEQDRAFAAFLREAWRDFDVAAGRVRDAAPKPDVAPRAPDRQPVPPPDTTRVPPPLPPPPLPVPPPPPPPPAAPEALTVEFIGLAYRLPLAEALTSLPPVDPGPSATADAWLRFNAVDHAPLAAALRRQAADRTLGDWGVFQLLARAAAAAYPHDPSRQALLHWFLCLRAGLDVRLAYAPPGYAVTFATTTTVYQLEFLVHDGRAYYVHDPGGRFREVERLRAYDGQPPLATRALALDFARLPATAADTTRRCLEWELNGEPRATEVVVDGQLVSYLATVPQTRLGSHFGAALSAPALRSLHVALAADLAAHDAVGQVALLLRFVQTAFDYATDQEQFGREDYLYPDESLVHRFCDCEDRAALFAVLVRELVGLEVVGLDYPGHVAAAVALPRDVPGDRLSWNGRTFTVCDPTYIGAAPGRSMPIAGADRPVVIAGGLE